MKISDFERAQGLVEERRSLLLEFNDWQGYPIKNSCMYFKNSNISEEAFLKVRDIVSKSLQDQVEKIDEEFKSL